MEGIQTPNTERADQKEKVTSIELQEGVQDFYQLRRECLATKVLFDDPEFPAHDTSVYYSKTLDVPIEWKRPTEIVDQPKFYIDGFSRFDLTQGDLSDCWFIAAVANLTMHPKLFLQVVPEGQSFEVDYAGIFHFRFWQYGKWVDVVIDDRLPTARGRLMYLRSPENKEFWAALIEKAYAKLNGSYEALVEGMNFEAMEDFTGGIVELYQMNAIPPDMFSILLKAQERNSLLGCLLKGSSIAKESKTPQGLVRWHCYSITQVRYVERKTSSQSEEVLLIRVRNPWGTKFEWNGKWSDNSPEWSSVSDSEREEMGLKFDNDGEFWMTFQDFIHYFTSIDICNLSPDSLMDPNPGKREWELSEVNGTWERGISAGGCTRFPDTFWKNPQYRITLDHPDNGDDKCTIIISLIQKNRRLLKWRGIQKLQIGFVVYKVKNSEALPNPLDKHFFDKYRNKEVAGSSLFYADRGVNRRFQLTPGVYCVVPSTFQPDQEGEFLLRIFSDSQNTNMKKNSEQIVMADEDDQYEKRTSQSSSSCLQSRRDRRDTTMRNKQNTGLLDK